VDLFLASKFLKEEALVDVVNVEFGKNLSQYWKFNELVFLSTLSQLSVDVETGLEDSFVA
jgi:hypothetical protein